MVLIGGIALKYSTKFNKIQETRSELNVQLHFKLDLVGNHQTHNGKSRHDIKTEHKS